MSDQEEIIVIKAVQKIIADVYGNGLLPDEVEAAWHLHEPWAPIGMDDPTLAQVLLQVNALIQTYKPKNSISPKDFSKAVTVYDLTDLVLSEVT